jgi:hypothetical protein
MILPQMNANKRKFKNNITTVPNGTKLSYVCIRQNNGNTMLEQD